METMQVDDEGGRSDALKPLTVEERQYYASLLPENATDRFYIDLEFIQNLCNARYLQYLTQQGYFNKPEFIKYLEYLKYWKHPNYLKYLLFPQCLVILDSILEKQEFKYAIGLNEFVEHMHIQQGLHWTKGRSLTQVLTPPADTEKTKDQH